MLAVQPYLQSIVDGFSNPSIQTILFLLGGLVFSSKVTQKALDARNEATVKEEMEPV